MFISSRSRFRACVTLLVLCALALPLMASSCPSYARTPTSNVAPNLSGAAGDASRAAQRRSLELARIHDVDEFIAAYEAAGIDDPDTVIALSLNVFLTLEDDETLGGYMAGLISDDNHAWQDDESPTGWFWPSAAARIYRDQLVGYPEVVRSFVGGDPNAGSDYPMADPETLHIRIDRVDRLEGGKRLKYFLVSSGKDMPAPMSLVRDRDSDPWKLESIGSVATGVRRVD